MTRKKDVFKVDVDLSDLFTSGDVTNSLVNNFNNSEKVGISIYKALDIVCDQLRQEGRRPRTISDYIAHVKHYAEVSEINDISEVTSDSIYLWLSSMDVSNSTKLIRLKCLKAFLERCNTNNWLPNPFWRNITIKVSTPVKKGAEEKDILFVLSMLDLSDFVQLRDATAILTLYQTGIRVETAALLREHHVDFSTKTLRLSGDIMKNHGIHVMPFDDRLARLYEALIKQNAKVRRVKRTNNDLLFITQHGNSCLRTPTNNNIAKRINKYRKEFGLKNFSAHALRRGFAKKLYDRSNNNIALVSKALSHSDISVTSRYLHLGTEEVAENVRKFL